ncbi:hypothetical protein KKC22_14280 [Myxococcota bacterium]|nr:hypothetical protein [Myxococcota bacterium]
MIDAGAFVAFRWKTTERHKGDASPITIDRPAAAHDRAAGLFTAEGFSGGSPGGPGTAMDISFGLSATPEKTMEISLGFFGFHEDPWEASFGFAGPPGNAMEISGAISSTCSS